MRLFPFIHRDTHDEITRDLRSTIARQADQLATAIPKEQHQAILAAKDALIEELRKALADAIQERRDVLDHEAKVSFGRYIFKPETPIESSTSTPPPAEEDEHSRLVSEARSRGYRSPRAIAEYITKVNEMRSRERIRAQYLSVVPIVPEKPEDSPGAEAAKADFQAAVNEGKAAAANS